MSAKEPERLEEVTDDVFVWGLSPERSTPIKVSGESVRCFMDVSTEFVHTVRVHEPDWPTLEFLRPYRMEREEIPGHCWVRFRDKAAYCLVSGGMEGKAIVPGVSGTGMTHDETYTFTLRKDQWTAIGQILSAHHARLLKIEYNHAPLRWRLSRRIEEWRRWLWVAKYRAHAVRSLPRAGLQSRWFKSAISLIGLIVATAVGTKIAEVW